MPKRISFSSEATTAVPIVLIDTHKRLGELEQTVKSVKRFSKILIELQKYVLKQWPLHVLYLISIMPFIRIY